MCSPSDDDEIRLLCEARDVSVIVGTDGVVDLLESLGIRGTQREDIDDIHRVESPTQRITVASRECGIEDFGVSGGWIEQTEADALTSLGPTAAERVAVLIAVGELRPALHLDHPGIVFPVAGSIRRGLGKDEVRKGKRSRCDSNAEPLASEANALSS